MVREADYLGLIPARGGSRGIVGKNMRPIGGKPMLQFTIEAALGSKRLDETILTSDDDEMIEFAQSIECQAPFKRPSNLASYDSPMIGAVLHAVDWMEANRGIRYRNVVLLQPTSPFRDSADIDAAVEEFERSGRESLASVNPVSQHPCDCVAVRDDRLEMAVSLPEDSHKGRQTFPTFYFINGAIYITLVDFLRRERILLDRDTALHIMKQSHSLDIDDQFEFDTACGLWEMAQRDRTVFES